MNLSRMQVDLVVEPKEDITPQLRAEESRLLRIIEAVQEIQKSNAWGSLKTELFDNLVNVLERNLKEEAKKENPSLNLLNRITGELKWAERFSDLGKLENKYRVELKNVRIKLNGKSE